MGSKKSTPSRMKRVVLPSVQGSFLALASANRRCWSGVALVPLSWALKRVLIALSLFRRVACAWRLWPAKRYLLPEGPRALRSCDTDLSLALADLHILQIVPG
eukprot:4843513-Amphidinium_carterae.1